MKVAFIYPEVYDIARFGKKRKEFPPFGVLYLATIVSMLNGVEVSVISIETGNESLNLTAFDFIAFSIPSSVTYEIVKQVRFQSLYSDKAILIAGGVHASLYPEATLRDLNVNAVGIGQGDETIVELISMNEKEGLLSIKGICFLQDSQVQFTESRILKKTLDHLPAIPNRQLLLDNDFVVDNRLSTTSLRMTHVMVSQGCPFHCNFCSAQQRKLQFRSGWHVRQELEFLKTNYGIEGFAVVGDNFLVNREHVLDICDSISDLNLKWSTLSRVDTIEHDILEKMFEAGCIEIKFGVESGSDRMLKAMGKGINRNQIYNALRLTHSVGIKVKVFIIHGYPGENFETTAETITMLDELSDIIERVSLFRFAPLPGSRTYEELQIAQQDPAGLSWGKCHIHHNHHHWWGSAHDFSIVETSYKILEKFVSEKWG